MICLERHGCCMPKQCQQLWQTLQPFPSMPHANAHLCPLLYILPISPCPYLTKEHSSILQNPIPLEVVCPCMDPTKPFARLWQSVKMKEVQKH